MLKDKKILIVGAGITGLSTAIKLEQLGLRPIIIDKASEFNNIGYFLTIWPHGNRLLRSLGVDVRDKSIEVNKVSIFEKRNKTLGNYEFKKLLHLIEPPVNILRAELQKKLIQKINSKVRFNTSIRQIKFLENNKSLVRFTDDSEDIFDLIVGSDGVNSQMRNLINKDYKPTFSKINISMFWIDMQSIGDVIINMWGDRSFCGVFPQLNTDKKIIYYTSANLEGFSKNLLKTKTFIKKEMNKFGEIGEEIINNIDRVDNMFLVNQLDVNEKKWFKGNLVLLGDAVHTSSPVIGVNGNMGIEDAVTLGDYLNKYDFNLDLMLPHFQKTRIRRVREFKNMAYNVDKLIRINPNLNSIRNLILRFIYKKTLISKMHKYYRYYGD